MTTTVRSITLPRQRRKEAAEWLIKAHPIHNGTCVQLPLQPAVRIVCISDTHNKKHRLPPGDVLIHAGDLTENGSFDEVQEQLSWLSSQAYEHKVLIAGNHDVLLDEAFLSKYPERRYAQTKTRHDLDWGTVQYLQDSVITLHVGDRSLRIYGSPWTPRYGISAFQYPRDEDVWAEKIPKGVDILITHGPPHLHLDRRDFHRAGCQYLAAEVARVRPKLVVFGHIHVSHGREDVVLDGTRRAYEEVIGDWAGWPAVVRVALDVVLARLLSLLVGRERIWHRSRVTTFVNAAVVGGRRNDLQSDAIVVEI